MDIEAGEVYDVNHVRKGKFRIRVESVSPEWVSATVLSPTKGLLHRWEEGDAMEIRRTLATFAPVRGS